MKVNSISGVSCYVEDLSRTAEFYEAIGFGTDETLTPTRWRFAE